MVSVFDVAKYILTKQSAMSTWKLQKLCYYAQAWHYTWTEKRLIEEEFEAWRNGPVCPALFAVHKGKFIIQADDIEGAPSNLNADEKDSIDVVMKDYGEMEPFELSSLTHSEAPWKDARGDLPKYANSNEIITLESMGRYYGSLI